MTIRKIKNFLLLIICLYLQGCALDQMFGEIEPEKSAVADASVVESPQPSPGVVHLASEPLLTEVNSDSAQESRFINRIKLDQTALELQRLALEIELLTLENQRIRQKLNHREQFKARQINTVATQAKPVSPSVLKLASPEMQHLYQQLQAQRQVIDQTLQQAAPVSHQSPGPASVYASSAQPQILKKPASDKVFFHTVYVLQSRNRWQDLWLALDQNNITDKWRGYNSVKQVHFIYVGAYAQLSYAERRALQLNKAIGMAPKIVTGTRSEKVASLLTKTHS